MDSLFFTCAIIGGTLVVCQFVLSLTGLGHEHADGPDDLGDHEGGGKDHGSAWIFGKLTLRTIAASLAFFGLAGLAARKAELETPAVWTAAVLAGLAAFYLVSWTLELMTRLNFAGNVSIEHSLDQPGTVYVAIPAGKAGAGKVHVLVAGRTLEYRAQTSGPGLAAGTEIRVVALIGHDTVLVAPILESDSLP